MPRQTFTAGEAARRLGISLDTLRRWDREGRIRTRRDRANRRIVPASEVERLRRPSPPHELSARNRLAGVVREVNREDWDLKWNAALETGGFLLSNKVRLEIEAELAKK